MLVNGFTSYGDHVANVSAERTAVDQPEWWRTLAACRGVVTDLFFPAGDVAPEPVAQAEQAKAICRECVVREECLQFALATHQEFGIWGGTTESERRIIRRRLRRRIS